MTKNALEVKKNTYALTLLSDKVARKSILAVLIDSPDTPIPKLILFVNAALGPAAPYNADYKMAIQAPNRTASPMIIEYAVASFVIRVGTSAYRTTIMAVTPKIDVNFKCNGIY